MHGPNETGERIDRKFMLKAVNLRGEGFDEHHAVVFLARDKVLPDVLRFYKARLAEAGAAQDETDSIELLIARVEAYHAAHPDEVKVPDVADGTQEFLLAPNGPKTWISRLEEEVEERARAGGVAALSIGHQAQEFLATRSHRALEGLRERLADLFLVSPSAIEVHPDHLASVAPAQPVTSTAPASGEQAGGGHQDKGDGTVASQAASTEPGQGTSGQGEAAGGTGQAEGDKAQG